MQMLRLNIRHSLPQTDLRIRDSRIDRSNVVPAQLHNAAQQATSNKGITQPSIEIDSYESRRYWGARNLTDLTREFGQKGLSDVKAGTSRRTQIMWSRAENGGKPGDDIKEQIMQEVHADPPETLVGFDIMRGVRIEGTPSEVVGEPDLGDVTDEIETTPFADLRGTPASVQTYLKDAGFIRRWISINEYDIYA